MAYSTRIPLFITTFHLTNSYHQLPIDKSNHTKYLLGCLQNVMSKSVNTIGSSLSSGTNSIVILSAGSVKGDRSNGSFGVIYIKRKIIE